MDTNTVEEYSVARRLNSAIELAQLSGRPVFALAAKPWPDARFRTLFAGHDASLVRLFNDPPKLRRAGFNLEHDGNSKIVMGELRRVVIPSWKIMELWRDGTLIYAVDARVQPFWGSPRPDGSFQLNPLALAEPMYLFAALTKLVYQESLQRPQRIEYRVHFERLVENGKRASLSEGPLGPSFFGNGNPHVAPDSKMDRTILWEGSDLEPGAVAYELVQKVYHWFGISDDRIPYTKSLSNGLTVIEPEALKKAGAQ